VSAQHVLAQRLRDDDAPLLVATLREIGHSDSAAASDLSVAVAAVREGYELHYGTPALLAPEDPDLALLAGDRLYALGLESLAAAGELEAIAALADAIALGAQAFAAADERLATAAIAAIEDVGARRGS
jgi:hypothetical protein